jgi:hypothetical protein
MASTDMVTFRKEIAAKKRLESQQQWERKVADATAAAFDRAELESSSSTTSNAGSASPTEDDDCGIDPTATSNPLPPKRRRPCNIVSLGLAAALDGNGVSDRKATYIIAEAAFSLGHDPKELNISRSSIERHREKQRSGTFEKLREGFKATPSVVQWDGKLLPELLGANHGKIDRLPVIATSVINGQTQLLGVPKLTAGTGEQQAAAVFQLLKEWKLSEDVVGMCFDTTASNTGRLKGACVLLEKKLGRSLIYLPCRHHIMEVILTGVFNTLYEPSSGPNILLFQRFQVKWKFIDHSKFSTAEDDDIVSSLVQDIKEDVIAFAENQLQSGNFRDDYKEFLELSILFLGGDIPGYFFKQPGAMHHARWMSKVIYSLKMWMFRKQLDHLTTQDKDCLQELSVFAVRFYIKAWITAPIPATAPLNDLLLLQKLQEYPSKVSRAALAKFKAHLWYLSEELVILGLFDPAVSLHVKREMLKAMSDRQVEKKNEKRPQLKPRLYTSLDSLVTENSRKLLDALPLKLDFLQDDPETWDRNPMYREAKAIINNLTVVNDNAERGVALIQEFNSHHTRDEDQLQFLLQVVTDHRKRFPAPSKSILCNGRE